jgi:hypothetical protein
VNDVEEEIKKTFSVDYNKGQASVTRIIAEHWTKEAATKIKIAVTFNTLEGFMIHKRYHIKSIPYIFKGARVPSKVAELEYRLPKEPTESDTYHVEQRILSR